MGFFDRFKFKKGGKPEPKFSGKREGQKEHSDNVLDMVKEAPSVSEQSKKPAVLKTSTGDAFRVLLRPEFSEKARMLAAAGKYVFVVHSSANKPQIKTAVEKVYDVHVVKVNLSRVFGKLRRYGRSVGRTKSWKKAIVSLRSGEQIEGLIDAI